MSERISERFPDDDQDLDVSSDMGHVARVQPVEVPERNERRRRRRTRKPGRNEGRQPLAVPIGLPFRIYVSTRWFSGLIVAALTLLLILFLTRDVFYIGVIYVGGTTYLSSADIFQRSGVARMHLFWVDPAEVEARLEQDPTIANATVELGWPPNMVQITITERQPALIWEQSGQRVWVDVQGHVMQLRQDLPGLVRVVVEKASKTLTRGPCPLQGMDEVLGPGNCIDPSTVAGALQFRALFPSVQELVYDPAKGLGFHDGNGWVLWFGDGTDMSAKMLVYNQIIQDVFVKQGRRFVEVNVADPDAPFYSLAPTRR